MIQDSAETVEHRLGFSLPPARPAFETFPTDYRIGLCGLAWVVQIMHLPAYRAARFRVTAGCEIDPKRIEEVQGSAHPLPRIYADYREMIASDEVDVIDCCFGHEPARAEGPVGCHPRRRRGGQAADDPQADGDEPRPGPGRCWRRPTRRGSRSPSTRTAATTPRRTPSRGSCLPSASGSPSRSNWRATGRAGPRHRTTAARRGSPT